MPATRSSRTKSKSRVDPSSRGVLPLDDEVIVISSDEEDVSSTAYALKKSRQEVRSLEKKLSALQSSNKQVLSDQGNHPSHSSSARPSEHGDEWLSSQARQQQTTAEIKNLESALRLEKKARAEDASRAAMDLENATVINQELHAEVKLLREELHAKTATKATNTLEDLENHILCEVCVEKLWSPFMLSGCGHTFCQGCLTDWFNANAAASRHNPQYTCPTCRTRVLQKPIEDFALKNIVRAISHAIDPSQGSPAIQSRNHPGQGPWFRFFRS